MPFRAASNGFVSVICCLSLFLFQQLTPTLFLHIPIFFFHYNFTCTSAASQSPFCCLRLSFYFPGRLGCSESKYYVWTPFKPLPSPLRSSRFQLIRYSHTPDPAEKEIKQTFPVANSKPRQNMHSPPQMAQKYKRRGQQAKGLARLPPYFHQYRNIEKRTRVLFGHRPTLPGANSA